MSLYAGAAVLNGLSVMDTALKTGEIRPGAYIPATLGAFMVSRAIANGMESMQLSNRANALEAAGIPEGNIPRLLTVPDQDVL
jgi:hypothetical protein